MSSTESPTSSEDESSVEGNNDNSEKVDGQHKDEEVSADDENNEVKTVSEGITETCEFNVKTWKEDLTLIVEEKQIFVSKTILAVASPVFEKMFESDFKEKEQNEITLPGKKYNDIIEFLRIIYPNKTSTVTKDNVLVLLPIADEYQVDSLKSKCVELLMSIVDETTPEPDIYRYLDYALKYNLDDVKSKCISEAGRKSSEDVNSAECSQLPLDIQFEIQKQLTSRLSVELKDSRFRQSFLMNEPAKSIGLNMLGKFESAKTSSFTSCVHYNSNNYNQIYNSSASNKNHEFLNSLWSIKIISQRDDGFGKMLNAKFVTLERNAHYGNYYNQPYKTRTQTVHVLARIIMKNILDPRKLSRTFDICDTFKGEFNESKECAKAIEPNDLTSDQGYVYGGTIKFEVFLLVNKETQDTEKEKTNE